MNKIYLIGNLTHDPELRSTPNGVDVCNFSIAVNRRFKDAAGNERTDFFKVQAWRQLAGLCSRFLAKGKKVAVIGSMQSGSCEKNGVKITTWDVVADEVEFLSSAHADEQAPQIGGPGSAPADQGFTQAGDEELPF